MSKIEDLARRFDHWMKNYDHHDDSQSQSFRNFITYDTEIAHSGTTYDEYVALAFHLNQKEYAIEWVVPYDTYAKLIDESNERRRLP